jgi:hypothetical protein
LYDYSPIDYFSNQINLKANLNADGQTVSTYEYLGENGVKLADYDSEVKNVAAYIQTKTKLNHDLILTFGMRHDIMDLSYNNYRQFEYEEQTYEPPKDILKALFILEDEIKIEMEELKNLIG